MTEKAHEINTPSAYIVSLIELTDRRIRFMMISSVAMFLIWLTLFALKDIIMAWFNTIGNMVASGVIVWLAWLSLLIVPLLGLALCIVNYLLVINNLPELVEIRGELTVSRTKRIANAWTALVMILWLLIIVLTVSSGLIISSYSTPYF